MTRYEWPASPKSDKDVALARKAHVGSLLGAVGPEVIENASLHLRTLMQALSATAPSGDRDLWVPVGPSTVVRGQATGSPRVSGRVRDLAVAPDGLRAYAATANGGVWYTEDAGASWMPVGAWGGAVRREISSPADPLVCGCLLVTFGATAADDDVLVGTGEIRSVQLSGTPGDKLGGVGILYAKGPVAKVRTDPLGNPWQRTARNLRGLGLYRMVRDPADPSRVVVATTRGLWTHRGAMVENGDWDKVTASPFHNASLNPDDDPFVVTDLVWTPERASPVVTARLWVAVNDLRTGFFTSDHSGLWVSQSGVAGPFRQIGLSGHTKRTRLGITRTSDERILYVLGYGPAVWRVDAPAEVSDIKASKVDKVPGLLFGPLDQNQADYDLTIAADPVRTDRIVLGGSYVGGDAALFRCDVTGTAPDYRLSYASTDDKAATDPTYIGTGVHADVHACAWLRVGTETHMWIGCDGGVYRSRSNGDRATFVARNTGLAALEVGYVASHPTDDRAMIVGTQDNGVLERIGDTIWERRLGGDGGGVAYNPLRPTLYLGQYTNTVWRAQDGTRHPIVLRSTGAKPTDSERIEEEYSSFYSGPAVTVRNTAVGSVIQVAVGSHRIWFSQSQPGRPETWNQTWVTLPSGQDPRRPGTVGGTDFRQNWTDDTPFVGLLDSYPELDAMVIQCRWATPDKLLVLCRGAIFLIDFDRARTPQWKRTQIDRYKEPSCGKPDPAKVTRTADHMLPIGRWSDIAPHIPERGARGSFYVAGTGPATGADPSVSPYADSLWWYDGTSKWYATGLRASPNGVPAPAYAVAVHPQNRDIVFVGTAVGVWRGEFTDGPDSVTWDWKPFVNGLPEAAVQDLSFFERGGQLLLRAALQARGVWEVDLLNPQPPRTYLRVDTKDSRRIVPRPAAPPIWDNSPDIRIRPAHATTTAPGADIPPVGSVGLPWRAGHTPGRYLLWSFQTALHAVDPLCPVDGWWTDAFVRRAVARRATLTPAPAPTPPGAAQIVVDAVLWNDVMTAANAYAEPWADWPNPGPVALQPTEADLYDQVVEQISATMAACRADRTRMRVDILVHHRHSLVVPADRVRVALAWRELPAAPADWPTVPVPWTADIQQVLRTGATAYPGTPPAGWTFGDAVLTRNPAAPLDARTPRSVTFDVDLRSRPSGATVILVAVAHTEADPVTLTGATLRELVLGNRHVAARSVQLS